MLKFHLVASMVYCYSSILVYLKTENMDKQIPTKLSFTGHGRRPLTRLNINWNTFHFFFYCSNTWNWTPLEEDQQKTIRTILIVPGIHPLVSPGPVQLATPAGPSVGWSSILLAVVIEPTSTVVGRCWILHSRSVFCFGFGFKKV